RGRIPIGWRDQRQLIVLDVNAKGVAAALLIAFPVIANPVLHKFKVLIQERVGRAGTSGKEVAIRQPAAEVVPVGRCRARRQYLTEHRDLLAGIQNLAQYIGAGSLRADHHKKKIAAVSQGWITVSRKFHRVPLSKCHSIIQAACSKFEFARTSLDSGGAGRRNPVTRNCRRQLAAEGPRGCLARLTKMPANRPVFGRPPTDGAIGRLPESGGGD